MLRAQDRHFFFIQVAEFREEFLTEFCDLNEEEMAILSSQQGLSVDRADKMIENVVGLFQFPIGFAPNFRIDGEDHVIPLVIEEPSVVAAASHAAKLLRSNDVVRTQ